MNAPRTVLAFPDRPTLARTFDPDRPETLPNVGPGCERILEWPGAEGFRAYFDRIPPYEVGTMKFFHSLAASGFVSVLTADVDDFGEDAVVSVTEPENGDAFSLGISEFVRYTHPTGRIDDPTERKNFLLRMLDSVGIEVEFQQVDALERPERIRISEADVASFRPEETPFLDLAGRPYASAFVTFDRVERSVEMAIDPSCFRDAGSANLLHALLATDYYYRMGEYSYGDDSRVVLMRHSGDSAEIAAKDLHALFVHAASRLRPALTNVSDERERVARFFQSYAWPEMREE